MRHATALLYTPIKLDVSVIDKDAVGHGSRDLERPRPYLGKSLQVKQTGDRLYSTQGIT
jgi:hypothetical protein